MEVCQIPSLSLATGPGCLVSRVSPGEQKGDNGVASATVLSTASLGE